jgi:purine nucleosidase
MGHPILLDCDPGADDALALYFALAHPGLDLLAVTTTYGRVPLAQATRNALLLCALAGRADLAVCSGVPTPTRKVMGLHDPQSHGGDGLGDLPGHSVQVHGSDERSAARCIVELARAHPGKLALVCAGPLGNLAQALRLEPHLPELLGRLVVAGGSIAAPGDVSPVAELNFWLDPHAADQVLTAGFPLTLLGLDVSRAAAVPLALVEELLARHPHPALEVLAHAMRVQARAYAAQAGGEPVCPSGGLLGLLHLLQPGLFQTVVRPRTRRARGPGRGSEHHGPARAAGLRPAGLGDRSCPGSRRRWPWTPWPRWRKSGARWPRTGWRLQGPEALYYRAL